MAYEDDNIARLLRQNKRMARDLDRLEKVFNVIKEGVIVVHEDGNLRYANRAAKKIFGIDDAIEKRSILQILPEITSCAIDADGETASSSEFEISYPERRFVRIFSTPFEGGEDDSIILVVSDITQEKISTEERIESEKIASVLKLASGVAHELGNPLNSIAIHLQLAQRRISKLPPGPDREKIRETARVCAVEVERLDGIINNFLNALRPARPNLAEIDPLAPLVATLGVLGNELENLGIEVRIESANMLPSMMGDTNLLKQLYFNLLKNSMEAMDHGGLISITADFNDNDVEISISDTGCGIDESEIMRIFEPYFTTKSDGHGLGMMIISEIMKSHGGTLGVKSKKDDGTTMTLRFPRKERRIRAIEGK